MIVTRLKLTNMRAIEAAEFRFQPGFNLIVGVNGVGKTSVLDALGVCLSAITKRVNNLQGRVEVFAGDDIRVNANVLTVECGIRIGDRDYTYLVHKPREASAPQKRKAGMPREQVHDTPERAEFLSDAPPRVSGDESSGRPLAVLFSTIRAVPSERAPGKSVTAGGVAAAFGDAFANRELRLGEFADWMRVQEIMRKERAAAGSALAAFARAVTRFLPGYGNLRLSGEDRRQLWIDRGRTAIPVRLLSDGERGTLALVLDLTRRLAQANPGIADPTAEAAAVVLIDEIDLHLHPKWQRLIVQNLRTVFPRCQFIATTHSPQIVAAVEPEQVLLLQNHEVITPDRTLGMDTNWILRHIMEADDRPADASRRVQEVEELIRRHSLKKARAAIAAAKELGYDLPEWSIFNARIARLEIVEE